MARKIELMQLMYDKKSGQFGVLVGDVADALNDADLTADLILRVGLLRSQLGLKPVNECWELQAQGQRGATVIWCEKQPGATVRREAGPDAVVCSTCGSTHIQAVCWYEMNAVVDVTPGTKDLLVVDGGGDSPMDDIYCPACEEAGRECAVGLTTRGEFMADQDKD